MTQEPLIDRVALVTGGSRGIGRGIALTLAARGASVVVTYQNSRDAASALVQEISAMGRRSLAMQSDVADLDSNREILSRLQGEFGRLDILVNNAGLFPPTQQIADVPPDCWQRVMQVNFFGCLYASQAAIPIMRSQGCGCIINISSATAKRLPVNHAAYVTSKAALEALVVIMAKEEGAHGIRVNAVRPGITDTDMVSDFIKTPQAQTMIGSLTLGRIGQPKDIAAMVAFLASDEASWVTGQILGVDGGGPTV